MSEHKYKRGLGQYGKDELVYVIAFDPGEITGWTVMGIEPISLLPYVPSASRSIADLIKVIDYGEIDSRGISGHNTEELRGHAGLGTAWENEAVDAMLNVCNTYPQAAIVLEDFVLDPKMANMSRNLLSPVRLIAKLTFGLVYVHDNPHAPERVFIQNRSPVKTTCTDDRLRIWGLYEQHPRDHIRDSTRHAYYFLRECRDGRKAAEQRWLAWPDTFEDPISTNLRNKTKRTKKLNPRIEGLG